jgi:hypothetical protein
MTIKSKVALIAVLVGMSIASPVFAQSMDHFGSSLPHYFDGSGELIWGSWGPPAPVIHREVAQAPAIVHRRVARSAPRMYMRVPSGAGAFTSAPLTTRSDRNPNRPALNY